MILKSLEDEIEKPRLIVTEQISTVCLYYVLLCNNNRTYVRSSWLWHFHNFPLQAELWQIVHDYMG